MRRTVLQYFRHLISLFCRSQYALKITFAIIIIIIYPCTYRFDCEEYLLNNYSKLTIILLFPIFSIVDCPPGYHAALDENKMGTCTPCPIGFYQTEAGKTTCDSCPKGFTTWHTGSYKLAQCKGIWYNYLLRLNRKWNL